MGGIYGVELGGGGGCGSAVLGGKRMGGLELMMMSWKMMALEGV